jgi:hypothetical protein
MANVRRDSRDYDSALADLNKVIAEDLRSADKAFNEGRVKATDLS